MQSFTDYVKWLTEEYYQRIPLQSKDGAYWNPYEVKNEATQTATRKTHPLSKYNSLEIQRMIDVAG